jgi:hypothetical protein
MSKAYLHLFNAALFVLAAAHPVFSGPDSAADSGKAGPAQTKAAPDTSAAARDSVTADSLARTKKLYEYISNPALQILTLPIDLVLAPLVKGAVYPFKAPLRYFLNENVIDRTIDLISFGSKDAIMMYPTMNLGPGTGSTAGLTFRHRALFGRPTEKLVARGNVYVNGDWKFRSYMTASELLGSGFDAKATVQFTRVKNATVYQPGTNSVWYFGDTANVFQLAVGHTLFEQLGARVSGVYRDNHFGKSPSEQEALVSPFFVAGVPEAAGQPDSIATLMYLRSRGLEKEWSDRIASIGLSRDTRNNENITLSGSKLDLSYQYHFTSAGHDYHGWAGEWTGYYKLGKEKFEISAAEERKAGPMNIKKVLKKMEYQSLRQELFNRKVLALHVYTAQSFEVPGNRMPVYGLNTLGNDTPMRGYAGSRFRDYTVLSMGGEYRFPVMRLVDGVIFDEYGVFGRSWEKIDYMGSLRNSWGFGIRVRRPDIHLFRVQLGFHGYQGIEFNMSVDAPY